MTGRARPLLTAVALAAAVLALPSALARADQPPAFTSGPTVAGEAEIGTPLQVAATWTGEPAPTPLYEWERCDATGLTCEPVPGACGPTYVPAFEDFADRLRARVQLWNVAGAAVARTPLSDLVLGAPTAPVPTAQPAATCSVTVAPVAPRTPASPAAAAASPAPTVGAPPARPAYMRPFPVVRIRGYSTPRGTRITLLSVRAPRSARVRATCAGTGCSRLPRPVAFVPPGRVRAFERFLPAGTVLRIRITAAAAIGKYTSFRILARRAPRRMDRCLVPGRWAPARCPAQ